jgi:ADP-heptose:LPS heptosyltransferase
MIDPRTRFYRWRQTAPLKRYFLAALVVLGWPLAWVISRLALRRNGHQRVLVIQMAGVGDLLMLTPALAALHDQDQNVAIDLITLHDRVKAAFENYRRLRDITMIPQYPGGWITERLANAAGARLLLAVISLYPQVVLKHLFRGHDVGINFALSEFDQNLGNALLYWLNIPRRVGVAGAGDKLLTDRMVIDYRKAHRVDAYLSLLRPLEILAAHRTYEFPISSADTETIKLLFDDRDIGQSRPLAVIHPGGKLHINSRRWPADYFARVCNYLASEGFEVVLTGDASDAEVCDQIVRTFGSGAKSVAGQLSFGQTAALLSKSELVITNDTATLHLAEAVRVPRVVSIFGPTDPALLAPRNERHTIFRSNLECAPCMGGIIDAKTERCWREVKEECLLQTTPEQVIGMLRTIYAEPAARAVRA